MEKKKKEDNNLTFSSITESIKTKLGEEESAKILDDVANILVLEKSVNDSIVEKDKTIDKLKSDKNTLIEVNGNLIKKIPVGSDDDDNGFGDPSIKEEKPEIFDFRTVFDKRGFKK